MASIFPENMTVTAPITIEYIVSKMFFFHTQAHLFHFQTPSYAEHKALNKLFDKLADYKDDIGEQAMGYMKVKPKTITAYPFVNYSPEALQRFLDDVQSFAKQLMDFGDSSGFVNLSNLAQEVSGLAASTRYLLTLK